MYCVRTFHRPSYPFSRTESYAFAWTPLPLLVRTYYVNGPYTYTYKSKREDSVLSSVPYNPQLLNVKEIIEKNCPCLLSGNLKIPTVSRKSSIYPISTNHKRKVGWIVRSLKSGSVNSTESFVQMIEKLLLSLTIVQPIHQSQTWPTFKSYFCPQIRRPFFNRWTKVSYAALKRITEEGLYVCYAEPWRKKSLVQRFQFCNQWRYWLILGRS